MGDKEKLKLFFTRKSVRKYKEDPIDREMIGSILEAARWAPSARNRQPWEFIIIDDPELKGKAVKATGINSNIGFLKSAPVLIVGLADKKKNLRFNGIDYYLVDFAIAMEHLILAAWEYGLGTCWVAWFSSKKLRSLLSIPKRFEIVAISPLGYPSDSSPGMMEKISRLSVGSKNRKEQKDFVFFNGYGR